MAEYLAPGVYVEEVSFRQKTIEGVSTSTAGFIGPARFGPVFGPPPLLTSFLDYERIYGGIDQLQYDGSIVHNYLAHAVRAFFENGGSRLYVTRAYEAEEPATGEPEDPWKNHGVASVGSPAEVTFRARYPGRAGNFRVTFDFRVGPNIYFYLPGMAGQLPSGVLRGALPGDTLLVETADSPPSFDLYWLEPAFDDARKIDTYRLRKENPTVDEDAAPLVTTLGPGMQAHVVTVNVTVGGLGRFTSDEFWEALGFHPQAGATDRRGLQSVFAEDPENRSAALSIPLVMETTLGNGVDLLSALLRSILDAVQSPPPGVGELLNDYLLDPPDGIQRPVQVTLRLTGGSDGEPPGVAAWEGDSDDEGNKSGLQSFEDIDDISIVAAPGSTDAAITGDPDVSDTIQQLVISHCERMRYRIAILDSRPGDLVGDVREYRGTMDTKHAALYYPWIGILDPFTEREISVPPSGFIAGIYARNDVERGVHKSPANEVVRLAIDFDIRLNKAQQDVLNPEGVNCLRFFAGRGFRVWGARTMTSDPEWKYVALRRYFAFLEHSIDKGTQWAVFEPNGRLLWDNVRRTIEDFLFSEWKNGHLLGDKPEEAYFVRCDLSTMTQNDLDNGRLVCLVGVAPLRPAEFVIFRIGQKTLTTRT